MVLGPDSALAGIIAVTVLPLAAGDGGRAVALAGVLSILAGILTLLMGVARLGFITDLLSKPIRYGYLNGIALTVLVGQMPKILGFPKAGENLVQEIQGILRGIAEGMTNHTALLVGWRASRSSWRSNAGRGGCREFWWRWSWPRPPRRSSA